MRKLFLWALLLTAMVTKGQSSVDLEKALSGKIACSIVPAGKDTAPRIIIRCGGSRLSGEPLVVVDGLLSDTAALRQLHPSNIVSVQVLKNGEASALYGNRGFAGAIVVQTNRVQVVDATDGQPLEGVTVSIKGKGKEQLLQTGSGGWLNAAPAVKEGHRLRLTAVGYQPLDTLLEKTGKPVRLPMNRQFRTQDTVLVVSGRSISCRLYCKLSSVIIHEFAPGKQRPSPVPSLLVYPNPVAAGGRLQFVMKEESAWVELVSLNGQVVYRRRLAAGRQQRAEVEVPRLAAGPYLLRVIPVSGGTVQTTSFIIQ